MEHKNNDTVNHPKHYNAGVLWKDKKPPAPKPCKDCGVNFQPYCGGDKFCPPCRPARARKRHREGMRTYRDKDRNRARRVKANWDLKRFGLTLEEYEVMFAAQNGCCAICFVSGKGRGRGILRTLCVDHCHETGRVRGLLCADCNTSIGLMRENITALKSAINYLTIHGELPCHPQ